MLTIFFDKGKCPTLAKLRITSGKFTGREYELEVGATTVGRSLECKVQLVSGMRLLSRRHCQIILDESEELKKEKEGLGKILKKGKDSLKAEKEKLHATVKKNEGGIVTELVEKFLSLAS